MLALSILLPGCSYNTPPCPFIGAGDDAPSSGCFYLADGELLVVKGLNGKIGLPGGLSKPGESAQCTAFRETWEETGLQLEPLELLKVFSKDFRLYRCDDVGLPSDTDPPLSFEVSDVLYLRPEHLDSYEWRFDEERDVVYALLSEIFQEGAELQSSHLNRQ